MRFGAKYILSARALGPIAELQPRSFPVSYTPPFFHKLFKMAPIALENEDHTRDADFNRAMHGKSANSRAGFSSLWSKDREAQKAASDEYWKHWDNKAASAETKDIRDVRDPSIVQSCNF